MKELVKVFVVLFLIFGLVPMGGAWLRTRPQWRDRVFVLICLMTLGGILQPAEWGVTLDSVETYRGHTKGYHFYFNQAFSMMLALALSQQPGGRFRWMPPGLWLYLVYCALSMLSLFTAPRQDYVLMTGFKFLSFSAYFIAAYNYIRTERELGIFLRTMALALIWEFIVVLKWKYINGVYQVRGTFEHQNPLSMYAIMIGLVFFSAGMGPGAPRGNLLLGAFVACAGIVQSTLSRAGLVIFAMGTMMVIGLALLDKPTKRRLMAVGALGVLGSLGLVLTIGTIISRFNDKGNQESGELRGLMNESARNMVRDYRLGIGWNNYALTINQPFPYGDNMDDWERDRGHAVDPDLPKGVVESHYYLLLSETGYQGLNSYLVLIVVFLFWNLRSMIYFRGQLCGSVSTGIFVGFVCNYSQSLLERVLTQPRNFMLWMLLLGVTARIETWRRESAGKPPAP